MYNDTYLALCVQIKRLIDLTRCVLSKLINLKEVRSQSSIIAIKHEAFTGQKAKETRPEN